MKKKIMAVSDSKDSALQAHTPTHTYQHAHTYTSAPMLWQYLEAKGVEYAPFDTDRMPRIFACIKQHIKLSKHIIHILGTNGKGSTGRFIALALIRDKRATLHFSSPHILRFNERFYINGSCVCDEKLHNAHAVLQQLATSYPIIHTASYFEYTTLLALVLAQECEYFICEAGLGGEFDSTSVLKEFVEVSVFTPISYDHTEFLGTSIESIATTKLKAMSKRAIIAPQTYPIVESIARHIGHSTHAELICITPESICETYATNTALREYAKSFAPFLQDNLIVAYKVLELLGITDMADMPPFDLAGRAQRIAPHILLDVGHNAECARRMVQIIGKKRINLVYNTFFQKNVREILEILQPIIDTLFIIPVCHTRILPKQNLQSLCHELGIVYRDFDIAQVRESAEYVVFGSFSVAEAFLEMWNARR